MIPMINLTLMAALEQALVQMDQASKIFDDDEEFQRARNDARTTLDAAREARGIGYDRLVKGSREALTAMIDGGYEDLARAEYGQEGSVEIDAEAYVAKNDGGGESSGAFVQAWVWVSSYDAARLAYAERCIELYKDGDRALVGAYRDSHPHEIRESDEDYLKRIAEQDFRDGDHDGCTYPELRAQLLKLSGYTSDDDDESTPGVAP